MDTPGPVETFARDDALLPTRREGRRIAASCWRRQRETGCEGDEAKVTHVVVYCSSTASSGRVDAVASGALTLCCELGCALVAFDFLGSGGSDDAASSFGYWERYDVMAAVDYAKTRFPGGKVVLWAGATSGAVACLLYGSKLDPHVSGFVLDSCVASLRQHVEECVVQTVKPTAEYRKRLVEDVVDFVDERYRIRTGVALDAVCPSRDARSRSLGGKPVYVIGEHDARGVATARHAEELHRSFEEAHPDGEHHLLVVQGRTARQRKAKTHVPRALVSIARFLNDRLHACGPKGFGFFTANHPAGNRDHLLAGRPPWDHKDPADAELAAEDAKLQKAKKKHKKKHHHATVADVHVEVEAAPSSKKHKKHKKKRSKGAAETRDEKGTRAA